MARLLITVGLDSKKSTAQPHLVYLGRSGEAQRTAESSSPHPRLLRLNHAIGIPKNNALAGANAAAQNAEEIVAEDVIEVTPEEMRNFQAHQEQLQKLADDRATKIATLEADLAKAREDLAKALAAATPTNPPASESVADSSSIAAGLAFESTSGEPAAPAKTSSGSSGKPTRK